MVYHGLLQGSDTLQDSPRTPVGSLVLLRTDITGHEEIGLASFECDKERIRPVTFVELFFIRFFCLFEGFFWKVLPLSRCFI